MERSGRVEAFGDLAAVPVDDDVGVQQRHDLREVLAAVRGLGSGNEYIGGRRWGEADQTAGSIERMRSLQRVDGDGDHADRPGTLDAIRSVVEKDDLIGRQPEVGRRLQIWAGQRLAFAEVRAVDEYVETVELRTADDPFARRRAIQIVAEDADFDAGRARLVDQGQRIGSEHAGAQLDAHRPPHRDAIRVAT